LADGVQGEVISRPLILKRSSMTRRGFDDYDVLSEGKVVGRRGSRVEGRSEPAERLLKTPGRL